MRSKQHNEFRLAKKIAKVNEYSKIINRQLDLIEEKDPDSVVLEKYRGKFSPITSKSPNEKAVDVVLKEMKSIIKSKALDLDSLKRSKANAIDTLRKDGIDYVNGRNFNSFMRFLDDARARHLGSIYSSEQLIEAIREAKKKGLTKSQIRANMDRWARKAVKYDKEGKIVEIKEPPKLNVRRVNTRKKAKR